MLNKYGEINQRLLLSALDLLDIAEPTSRDLARLDMLYHELADNLEAAADDIRENAKADDFSVIIRVSGGQAVRFKDEAALAEYITSMME